MNKKSLKIVSLFAFVLVVILLGVLGYRKLTNEENLRGQYAFAQVKNDIKDLNKITMTTPRSGVINIYRQGDFWHFKEASDYFVNMDMLSHFYEMINNSIVASVEKGTDELLKRNDLLSEEESEGGVGQGTEIAIYNSRDELLSHMIIGKRVDADNDYVYARKKDGRYIYKISDVGRFSGEAPAWMPYPLLQIEAAYLDNVEMDGKVFSHQQLMRQPFRSSRVRKVLHSVAFVDYQGIVKKEDFFASAQNLALKEIKFNMIGGFGYVLHIYKTNEYYWLEVTLVANSLAHPAVGPFVKDNQQYFSDWVFQLYDDQGELLYGE